MNTIKLVTAAVSLLIAVAAVAQPATPVVTERQANQQARIAEGVQSGELAKGEVARLRAEQRALRAEKRMVKADGVVTTDERAQLAHDQKAASRHIRKQKHDARKRQ
jgi:hypothetical protein